MKPKILWGAISIFILLTSAAFTPPIPEGPLPDQGTSPAGSQPNPLTTGEFLATISPVQGEIYWRQQTEKDWFSINNQQGLDTGNQVLTKAEGRAKIEYFDGIIVRVGPHTLFTVTEQTQTENLNLISRIRLIMGQIFIKHGEGYYQGKFEVETPSGLAAVKGTMMSVQINAEGQTLVTCLEGVCALSNASGELTLTEGQGGRIESEDQPPQPAEIEDWQLNDWFENDPEAIAVALRQGLATQDPKQCTADTGVYCSRKYSLPTFVSYTGAEISTADEQTETNPETSIILDPATPGPDITILPPPPEEINPSEDPIPPENTIEQPPDPVGTPCSLMICHCSRRHHHR